MFYNEHHYFIAGTPAAAARTDTFATFDPPLYRRVYCRRLYLFYCARLVRPNAVRNNGVGYLRSAIAANVSAKR